MSTLEFLAAPLVFAVLLVTIHSYLGLHVLSRDIIFVDISLSQVAALGTAIGHLLMGESVGRLTVFVSLGCCLFVAFVLALFRSTEKKVSQEVIIGVTYALASGLLFLIWNKLPHGAENLKTALIGNILFVTWSQVIETLLVYGFVGLIFLALHKVLWSQSTGKSHRFIWDLLFYFLFGVVITFSTQHAGVLVVFTILVVPAAISSRFAKVFGAQILLAWLVGSLGLIAAFWLSLKFDWPTGAGIVTTFASLFFCALTIGLIYEKWRKLS